MPDLIKCAVCVREDKKPFVTPYDSIGVALMKEHLKAEHNEIVEIPEDTA